MESSRRLPPEYQQGKQLLWVRGVTSISELRSGNGPFCKPLPLPHSSSPASLSKGFFNLFKIDVAENAILPCKSPFKLRFGDSIWIW